MARRKTKTRAKKKTKKNSRTGGKSKSKSKTVTAGRSRAPGRSGSPALLSRGVSYWSFPGGMENRTDIISALSSARQLGFSSLELGISDTGVLTLETSRSECRALARAAEAVEVGLSSLATNLYWTTNLASPRAAERNRAVEITTALIERAAWLDARAVVVIPGWVHSRSRPEAPPVPYDEAMARARESVKKCVKIAEKARITLALLNAPGGLMLSPLEFSAFIEGLRSRRAAACLDIGTAALYGHPHHWIKLLRSRIALIRATDLKRSFEGNVARSRRFRNFGTPQGWGFMAACCQPGTGSVDWPAVGQALRKARYKGPLIALSHPPRPGLLEHTGAFLDKLIGSS